MTDKPDLPNDTVLPQAPDHLEFKAVLLLSFMLALIVAAAVYVMYSRGLFESTQKLVLVSEDSEGVVVGMNLTFSGFPIGRVRRIELADDGKARIVVDVASKDAHWLRQSSVFTLVRGLVGGTNIRAYTGVLTDKLLEDGAVRTVLQGDAGAEVPKLIATAKDLLESVSTLLSKQGALGASLGNLQTLTAKINGPGGALTVLLGGEAEAKKLITTLDRTNALLAKVDGLAAKADAQVFGEKGVLPETRSAVVQLNSLLSDARASLKKVDAVLVEAQAVGANVKEGTSDLSLLRGEVESSLRKVDGLINEINRKWPFARDTDVKLP
ncbi:MAG: MlaD family protein [Polaromonas sp.]|jgi:phospholipid/cholesterol/gamma-HCH transport system substrate-binding protein